jgi:hypothetical protein
MIVIGALCMAQTTLADQRISISGGAELGAFSGNSAMVGASPYTLHLQATMDAPGWLRKHVPLEFVFGFTGPYPTERHIGYISNSPSSSSWYSTNQQNWRPQSRFSEAVRLYIVGHNTRTHKPDGMELALGIGNHQVFSKLDDYYHTGQKGIRLDSQWRAHLAFRTQFLPTQPSGPVLELELQHGLERLPTAFPDAAALTLGWRFQV